MIQFQAIKRVKNRFHYICAVGKRYIEKNNEIVDSRTKNPEKISELLDCLDKEKTSDSSIVAREMIIPIPNFLNKDEMKKFASEYVAFMKEKIPFMRDKNFLYLYSIHSKKNEKGIINNHIHFLYADRLLLDEPEVKHIKTRYYDENGKMTTKDKSKKVIYAHDEIRHFGKKIMYETLDQKNHRLNDKHFLWVQDKFWCEFCYQNKYLTKGQLDQIFTGLYKTKHIGVLKHTHTAKFIEKRNERIKLNEAIKFIRKNKKSLSNEQISRIKADVKQEHVFEIAVELIKKFNLEKKNQNQPHLQQPIQPKIEPKKEVQKQQEDEDEDEFDFGL